MKEPMKPISPTLVETPIASDFIGATFPKASETKLSAKIDCTDKRKDFSIIKLESISSSMQRHDQVS